MKSRECRDVLEKLDSFVDAELDAEQRSLVRRHLESCAACDAVYRESVQLKRLLQRRAFQPRIPGGLANRILGEVTSRASASDRFRAVVVSLAAAILVLVVGWMFVSVVTPPAPLAHATVVREVASRFGSASGPGIPVTDVESALEQIRKTTGIRIDSIPRIPETELVAWRAERVLNRPSVCLSYRDTSRGGDAGDRRRDEGTIMLFVIPADGSRFPAVHLCDCVDLDGPNVLCFTYGHMPMSLVTTVDGGEMKRRLIRMQKELRAQSSEYER